MEYIAWMQMENFQTLCKRKSFSNLTIDQFYLFYEFEPPFWVFGGLFAWMGIGFVFIGGIYYYSQRKSGMRV